MMTRTKFGHVARMKALAATMAAPTATTRRFAAIASTSAPAGICATTPAIPPLVSARPTAALDQWRSAR